jgi:molybdate transport system ATP-binding protein
MHLYYLQDQPCVNIVGSGFFDSIGLHRKCTEEQLSIALKWMDVFEITHLRDISFLKLSYGEQRLALLARAFVKNPDLLILDEPLHGLDKSNKILASKIIEKFCNQDHKTLIYVTHYLNEIPASVTQRFELKKQS